MTTASSAAASVTEPEAKQVERANATGLQARRLRQALRVIRQPLACAVASLAVARAAARCCCGLTPRMRLNAVLSANGLP